MEKMRAFLAIFSSSSRKARTASELYRLRRYDEALKYFNKALDGKPTCALYHDRAATYLMMKRYTDALTDVQKALKMDPGYISGHLLEAKCHLAMGRLELSIQCCETAQRLDEDNEQAKTELKTFKGVLEWQTKGLESIKNGDFLRASLCYEECIKRAAWFAEFSVMKAEALSLLGDYDEAAIVANELVSHQGKAEAKYIRGHCLYYQDETDKAFRLLEEALQALPDYQRAVELLERAKRLEEMKRRGDTESKAGNLEDALHVYTEALTIDPYHKLINAKLLCNRGTVYRQMGRTTEAIDDLSKSAELNEGYIEVFIRRAKCYIDNGNGSEAEDDYSRIVMLDPTRDHERHGATAADESKDKKRFQKMHDCPKCYRTRMKRKKIVQEIMDTEVSYGTDLVVLKEEFYEPLKASDLLRPEKLERIFLNLDELILVNTLLRNALKSAREASGYDPDEDYSNINIGTIFLESASTFQTFEKYILYQAEAAELLERKERQKDPLRHFLQDIQQNKPRVRRMQLQSFLLVPVQRIMKYPLLLDRLHAATPDSHKDKNNIHTAKEKVEVIIRDMNNKSKARRPMSKKKR